ncbi:HAD-IA family hydrolase [Streptomyces sp. WAC 06783]|uniref:HAD-IA family hydrolase n=1 Tax=Streptomyces sp. WAC 06783 TaxID=2203211 RepID=UPI0021AD9FF6|nr:HAD-IA family hydrolase [Streptomyces sp. WAC 06783]
MLTGRGTPRSWPCWPRCAARCRWFWSPTPPRVSHRSGAGGGVRRGGQQRPYRRAKPDPHVFTTAAGRAGAEPRRCLFADDSLGNVTAARTVGMAGLHYRNIGQLREAVAPLPG